MICSKCGLDKDVIEFYISDKRKCKQCHREYVRNYSLGHKEQRRKHKKLYWKRHPKKAAEHSRNMRQKHPEHFRARDKANWEYKMGRLKRLPCSICGERHAEAHHADYSRPLEIIWLCRKHHCALHGKRAS
jgi:hypothetical protein